jgi:hypothetical protein
MKRKLGRMSTLAIREAREEDARLIGWAILAATRSPMPREWFDIALGLDEKGGLAFTGERARTEALGGLMSRRG